MKYDLAKVGKNSSGDLKSQFPSTCMDCRVPGQLPAQHKTPFFLHSCLFSLLCMHAHAWGWGGGEGVIQSKTYHSINFI